MRIGILLTGHSAEPLIPRFDDYDAMFRRLLAAPGNVFETWPVVDGVFPTLPSDADAWVLTGSRCAVYDNDPWIARLEKFLRDAADKGVPILGICFGHQLIAQTFGGTVRKFEGGWNTGLQNYVFDNMAHPVELVAWHQDQIIEPPAEAQIVATSATCRYAAMRIGQHILSLQAHPEFTAEYVRALATVRRDVVGTKNAKSAIESLDGGSPDDFSPYLLDFLQTAGGSSA